MTPVPAHLSSRWLPDHSAVESVRHSLLRNRLTNAHELPPEVVESELHAHLLHRVKGNRERVIPWLASTRELLGARILEIGCGTGASTLALAEQGAEVTAIDIAKDAIQVAYDRCAAYGVKAEFIVGNAENLASMFFPRSFDWILIYATLEHMTFAERMACLKGAWAMLPPGAFLSVIETPNRLWFHDDHTALLPFYHWLPNEVAFHYSRFSERATFKEVYRDYTPEQKLKFLRRGRGVSFHDLELAIAPRQQLRVVSYLNNYHRERNPAEKAAWKDSPDAVFEALLHYACPDVDLAFLQPYLDVTLQKT